MIAKDIYIMRARRRQNSRQRYCYNARNCFEYSRALQIIQPLLWNISANELADKNRKFNKIRSLLQIIDRQRIHSSSELHKGIRRSSSSLRYSPLDELLWCFEGTCLAMNAVLCINNQISLAISVWLGILINTCGKKSLFRSSILLD